MERGPLTLFGAILAVGLGPSLWLGAQLGSVNVAPNERPSTVGERFPESDVDFGGTGAGATTDQADPIVQLPAPAVSSRTADPAAVVSPGRSVRASSVPPASAPTAAPSSSPSAVPSSAAPSASTGSPEPSQSVGGQPSEEPEPSDPPADPSPSETVDDPGDDGEGSLDSPLLVADS